MAVLMCGDIPVELVRSNRKTIGLQVKPDGTAVLRAPRYATVRELQAFLDKQEGWLQNHMAAAEARQEALKDIEPLTNAELKALAEEALQDIPKRVEHFAPVVGVTYGRITIRNQKTRWGSCSSKGNLNFNCLLMLAPEEVRDYVVVHELCHRKEMNHSAAFWREVEQVLPDYRQRERWLKEHGDALQRRLGN